MLPAKSVDLKHIVIISIFLLGLLFSLGLWYLRRRSMRSLNVKYLLHQLAHFARDTQVLLAKASSEIRLRDVTSSYAGRVKEYFEELLPNIDIQVAIRIVEFVDCKTCYKIITRTSGLNSGRENYTEPLAADEGIARFLQSESAGRGVLIYHDLKEAAKIQAYQLTKNDEKYPDDISTMMVAGLNASDGSSEKMIGILYITSRNKKVFKEKHVDLLGFAADIGASTLCRVIQHLNSNTKTNAHIEGGKKCS